MDRNSPPAHLEGTNADLFEFGRLIEGKWQHIGYAYAYWQDSIVDNDYCCSGDIQVLIVGIGVIARWYDDHGRSCH